MVLKRTSSKMVCWCKGLIEGRSTEVEKVYKLMQPSLQKQGNGLVCLQKVFTVKHRFLRI